MANPFPYMPYWVRDFEGDPLVDAMSTLGVGAYHRLLWKAWHQKVPGTLPSDDATLRTWARVSEIDWAACAHEVLACFKLGSDNRWHQKRMKAEYARLCLMKKDRSSLAKKASDARWHKDKKLHADAMPTHCIRNAKPEPESNQKKETPPPPGGGGPAPNEDPDEELEASVRRFIGDSPRLPLWTPKQQAGMCKLVTALGWDRAEALVKEAGKDPNVASPIAVALVRLASEQARDATKPKVSKRGEWANSGGRYCPG